MVITKARKIQRSKESPGVIPPYNREKGIVKVGSGIKRSVKRSLEMMHNLPKKDYSKVFNKIPGLNLEKLNKIIISADRYWKAYYSFIHMEKTDDPIKFLENIVNKILDLIGINPDGTIAEKHKANNWIINRTISSPKITIPDIEESNNNTNLSKEIIPQDQKTQQLENKEEKPPTSSRIPSETVIACLSKCNIAPSIVKRYLQICGCSK